MSEASGKKFRGEPTGRNFFKWISGRVLGSEEGWKYRGETDVKPPREATQNRPESTRDRSVRKRRYERIAELCGMPP